MAPRAALRSRGPMPAKVLAGDGTRFLGLRSCGPIAVSTSIISRLGLRLGGSTSAGAEMRQVPHQVAVPNPSLMVEQ
jgi:hypothetical protein